MIEHALVRPPGVSFARAISTSGAAIDVALAQAQHAEYCQALAAAGVQVEVLPPDERYPDSCFMQDPALVIEGVAIIARPAAASRQGEEAAAVERLPLRQPGQCDERGMEVHEVDDTLTGDALCFARGGDHEHGASGFFP